MYIMDEFNLNEYCDCLEYDYIYDKEEFNTIMNSNNIDKISLLKPFHNLINRRQLSILKLIGDNYIENGIPDRLLDIYFKIFALEAITEKFIHLHQSPEKIM